MKKLLYVVLALVAIITVLAIMAPKDFQMEREIVINKPKAEVFEYVKSLKSQDNWSVWAQKDPNMKKEFKGEDGTVGCISMWEGNDEVGKGEQEITKITDGERVDFELRFLKPFEVTNAAWLITESIDENQTKVKWGFSGGCPFPMNFMMLFMDMDKAVGPDFENGLANLKNLLEA